MIRKFIYLLLITSFSLSSYAQQWSEIPVKDGKVEFEGTILSPASAEDIKTSVEKWIESDFLSEKGVITNLDTVNNIIVCRVMDPLKIQKGTWTQYVMYLRYTLIIEYQTNQCKITARNIGYVDPDDLRLRKDNYTVFPAETVLIEKNFKELFVQDAVEKIETKTIDYFEDLFFTIGNVVKK